MPPPEEEQNSVSDSSSSEESDQNSSVSDESSSNRESKEKAKQQIVKTKGKTIVVSVDSPQRNESIGSNSKSGSRASMFSHHGVK